MDNVASARFVHFNDVAEGDDHPLNSAEKADHGRHAGHDREHREMSFECRQYMSAVRFHAFDDLFLQSRRVIVEFAEDQIFSQAIGKNGSDRSGSLFAPGKGLLDSIGSEIIEDRVFEFGIIAAKHF